MVRRLCRLTHRSTAPPLGFEAPPASLLSSALTARLAIAAVIISLDGAAGHRPSDGVLAVASPRHSGALELDVRWESATANFDMSSSSFWLSSVPGGRAFDCVVGTAS